MRAPATLVTACVALGLAAPAWAAGRDVSVHYTDAGALRGLDVAARVPALHDAVVVTRDLRALRGRPGIVWAEPTVARTSFGGQPVVLATSPLVPEWQLAALRANTVPSFVLRAASRITIAVVDTGADLTAPSLAAKSPRTYSVLSGTPTVTDLVGHGTFVASLAAGSASNGKVFEGFGGGARLMIVQASETPGDFNDANEAAGIVWAVDHGARIVNLSLGGTQSSQIEQDAVNYAVRHGVLLVAAAGNDGTDGDAPVYPAALLGSDGLAVGASTRTGKRALFSPDAWYVALCAPGLDVIGAIASTSPADDYPRVSFPGVSTGLYGYGTGTSFAAPEVAGAAALVWAAHPTLTATQVIGLLESTASNAGNRAPGLGYGVIDVGGAVALALGKPAPPVAGAKPTVITLQASTPKR
jgi:subtilisin family serine protease